MTNHTVIKKTAWLVGVNQGIGADVMQRLLDEDVEVIGIDKTKDKLPAALQQQVHICDIRDEQQIVHLCETLLRVSPPDYFIHIAGVLHLGQHDDMSSTDWLDTFAVNVFSCFHFCQKLTPYFKEKRSGSIVVVSSNAAAMPRINMSAYGASKSALTYFTKTVALELAEYGVKANVVSPGSTGTAMQTQLWTDDNGEQTTIAGSLQQYKLGIPLQKIAQVKDITNAIMFFISDQSSHITMQDLVVDGGATLGC